jgi:hypothetical protein
VRWTHPDPNDREETVARNAIVRRMDRWWEEFDRRASDLDLHFRQGKDFDVAAFMHDHLQSIDERLMWEFGPGPHGKGHRLTLTPEAHFQLRPMVDVLMEKAPELSGWTLMRFRPRENPDQAEVVVQSRTGGSLKLTRVGCKIGGDRKIDLTFHFPPGPSQEAAQGGSCAFVGAESLLGEESVDQWVGVIESAPLPKRGWISSLFGKEPGSSSNLAAPADLASFFDEVKATVMDRALDPPWRHSEKGVVLKVEPETPSNRGQGDLRIASSLSEEVWKAQHSGRPFFSCRFGTPPSSYCYVKMDGSSAPEGEEVKYRSVFEDALAEALGKPRLGGVLGGGWGAEYLYVELAVADPKAAIPVIRETLRSVGVPARSWLLFHDEYLSSEWVGMWDGTPPPPADEFGRVSGCFKDLP